MPDLCSQPVRVWLMLMSLLWPATLAPNSTAQQPPNVSSTPPPNNASASVALPATNSSHTAAAAARVCQPGHFRVGSACRVCPANTYKTAADSATQCQACPPGTDTALRTGVTQRHCRNAAGLGRCCTCSVGTYNVTDPAMAEVGCMGQSYDAAKVLVPTSQELARGCKACPSCLECLGRAPPFYTNQYWRPDPEKWLVYEQCENSDKCVPELEGAGWTCEFDRASKSCCPIFALDEDVSVSSSKAASAGLGSGQDVTLYDLCPSTRSRTRIASMLGMLAVLVTICVSIRVHKHRKLVKQREQKDKRKRKVEQEKNVFDMANPVQEQPDEDIVREKEMVPQKTDRKEDPSETGMTQKQMMKQIRREWKHADKEGDAT